MQPTPFRYPLPQPIPHRPRPLPQVYAKRMTIALGVLARDGVVLAADTEYTWGYLKTSGEKIRSAECACGALAMAGAGDAGYLGAVCDDLVAEFQSYGKNVPVPRMKARFEGILVEFHKKHVVPYGDSSSVAFWLLLAFQRGRASYLWSTCNGAMMRRAPYASIGLGCEYADALLGQMFGDPAIGLNDVSLASRVAAYAVHQTKENVQNCGKKTSLVILRGGTIIETSGSKLVLLNSYFGRYADIQRLGARYALGFPYGDDEKATLNLMAYLRNLRIDMLDVNDLKFEGKTPDLE